MARIDLNCDMGEGMPDDALLMACISSANIACGRHAGSPSIMEETVALAVRFGVAIGAHPGFDDFVNFGRVEVVLPATEVRMLVLSQIQDLQAVCLRSGASLRHVKPHGALYNMAARDPVLARAIAEAIAEADRRLVLYGLLGSHLISEGRRAGLLAIGEIFADRTYLPDGSLTPRSSPHAFIEDESEALAQTLRLMEKGAETVCLHGDGPKALAFAVRLRQGLIDKGVDIKAPMAS
jgi:UPF0271 protein